MMHIKTVLKYMRRSPYQSVAAALIMALTFLTISVFAILTILSVRMINYFESRPQLSVFFADTATSENIASIRQKLDSTGKTLSIKFVSKEEALDIYREQNKDDPLLLDLVTADILPASLDIQAQNPEDLSVLASIVKDTDFIEEVIFQKDIVDTLIKWTNAFRQIGIAVVAVLLLVSTFVILTVIGIKITVRREEIEIMKLIGASDWFIRAPFVLEGMIYGAIGAIVGWSIAYAALVFYAAPLFTDFLSGVSILPIDPLLMIEVLGVELLAAIFLGFFASYLAVLRHLK